MKTICTKVGDVSIHLFEDTYKLEYNDKKIFVYNENGSLLMALANSDLYHIYENISAPENWSPRKYKFSSKNGWRPSGDWKFPYHSVFDVLYQKHLQLIQCLYDKEVLDKDDFLLLTEFKTLEKVITDYKTKYENTMS